MAVQTRDEVLVEQVVYNHLIESFDKTLEVLNIKGYEQHLKGLEDFSYLSVEGETLSIRFFTRDVLNHLLSDIDFLLNSTFNGKNKPKVLLYKLFTEREETFYKYNLELYFI